MMIKSTPRRSARCSGQSTIEFTLVSIPLIFILISTVEMARGMWNYEMLASAVRAGAHFASTHGKTCGTGLNTCTVKVSDVAKAIQSAAPGLPSDNFNIVMSSATAGPVSCSPLTSCLSNSARWPPLIDSGQGLDVSISASYTFRSAMSMFWPGAGHVQFGVFTFVAYTRQPIQF